MPPLAGRYQAPVGLPQISAPSCRDGGDEDRDLHPLCSAIARPSVAPCLLPGQVACSPSSPRSRTPCGSGRLCALLGPELRAAREVKRGRGGEALRGGLQHQGSHAGRSPAFRDGRCGRSTAPGPWRAPARAREEAPRACAPKAAGVRRRYTPHLRRRPGTDPLRGAELIHLSRRTAALWWISAATSRSVAMNFVRPTARETPRRREVVGEPAPPSASASRAQPRGSSAISRAPSVVPRGGWIVADPCSGCHVATDPLPPLGGALHVAHRVPRGGHEAGVDHDPAARWISGRAPLKLMPAAGYNYTSHARCIVFC